MQAEHVWGRRWSENTLAMARKYMEVACCHGRMQRKLMLEQENVTGMLPYKFVPMTSQLDIQKKTGWHPNAETSDRS